MNYLQFAHSCALWFLNLTIRNLTSPLKTPSSSAQKRRHAFLRTLLSGVNPFTITSNNPDPSKPLYTKVTPRLSHHPKLHQKATSALCRISRPPPRLQAP